jgi:hypothetical protein
MTWLRDEASTESGPVPFCCKRADGGMRINLKRGVESFCFFCCQHYGQSLLIHFFYNRQFREQPAILEDGSYSKSFRPDYTLLYCQVNTNRKLAQSRRISRSRWNDFLSTLRRQISYRPTQELFGAIEETEIDRKEAKTTGTVKNADLYKMHITGQSAAPLAHTALSGLRCRSITETAVTIGMFTVVIMRSSQALAPLL